jgi:hypothetical protein
MAAATSPRRQRRRGFPAMSKRSTARRRVMGENDDMEEKG